MSTQQQDPYWNAGATEIQRLNPYGPDRPKTESIELQPTVLKVFRPEPSLSLSHDTPAYN